VASVGLSIGSPPFEPPDRSLPSRGGERHRDKMSPYVAYIARAVTRSAQLRALANAAIHGERVVSGFRRSEFGVSERLH
jgi:hypothetical protein